MTYEKRLLFSKLLINGAALLAILPLFQDGADRAVWFWAISLPVFFYLLWGGLHGTGRSVRTVGYLGLAYGISYALSAAPLDRGLYLAMMILFAVGVIISIRRRSEQSD